MAVKDLTTEIEVLERYPTLPLSVTKLKFVFTAPTAFADGIRFPITGRELILVQNTDGGAPQTFTITSARDVYGRTGDITTYSIGASGFAVVPTGAKDLFGSTGGTLTITMSANTVKVAVLRGVNMLAS